MGFERLLEHYGVYVTGGWKNIHCISPDHEDRSKSARVSVEDEGYFCHACGLKAGSPIQLVMKVEGVSRDRALAFYKKVTGEGYSGVPTSAHELGYSSEISSRPPSNFERSGGFLQARRSRFTDGRP